MRFADFHLGLHTSCTATLATTLIRTDGLATPPKANKAQNPLSARSFTRVKQENLHVLQMHRAVLKSQIVLRFNQSRPHILRKPLGGYKDHSSNILLQSRHHR